MVSSGCAAWRAVIPWYRAPRLPADQPVERGDARRRVPVRLRVARRARRSARLQPGRHLLGGDRGGRAPPGAPGDPARAAAARGSPTGRRRSATCSPRPSRRTWSSRRCANCARCPARTASRPAPAGWCCSATPRTPCRTTSARAPVWRWRTRPRCAPWPARRSPVGKRCGRRSSRTAVLGVRAPGGDRGPADPADGGGAAGPGPAGAAGPGRGAGHHHARRLVGSAAAAIVQRHLLN